MFMGKTLQKRFHSFQLHLMIFTVEQVFFTSRYFFFVAQQLNQHHRKVSERREIKNYLLSGEKVPKLWAREFFTELSRSSRILV